MCSGIEAASVAWAPLGWRAAWLSEVERYPCAVLAHHYPAVPNLGDMRHIPVMLRAGALEAPDILCGGTPCQSFSVAGLRRSLDDDRGNLSLTFYETANAIDDQRDTPCIIVWENVPGVLSTPDNAFGCFLAGLAGEDDPLVPTTERPANGRSSELWKWSKPLGRHIASWSNAGAVYGPRRTVAWRTLDAQWFGLAQRRRRVFVVASARDDFDPVAVLFEFEGVRRDSAPSRGTGEAAAGTLAASAGGSDENDAADGRLVAFGGNNTSGAIDVAAGLNAHGSSGRMDFESETFIAFDTTQITSPDKYSAPRAGDRCHPLAAGAHAPAIAFDARQNCVSSTERFGALSSMSPQSQAVAAHSGVRRLTPLECERLQGFPDDYTLLPDRTADGPRYRALGNSWPIPVVRWIGARIAAQLP